MDTIRVIASLLKEMFGTSVTIKLAPVKTSTAYLLFYDSVHADI